MYTAAGNRYEVMDYKRCGISGLLLPRISLGLWHNFGDNDDYGNMQKMNCHYWIRLIWNLRATCSIILAENSLS